MGDANPAYSETFVFVNDYSAVKEDQQDYVQPESEGRFALRSVRTGRRGSL